MENQKQTQVFQIEKIENSENNQEQRENLSPEQVIAEMNYKQFDKIAMVKVGIANEGISRIEAGHITIGRLMNENGISIGESIFTSGGNTAGIIDIAKDTNGKYFARTESGSVYEFLNPNCESYDKDARLVEFYGLNQGAGVEFHKEAVNDNSKSSVEVGYRSKGILAETVQAGNSMRFMNGARTSRVQGLDIGPDGQCLVNTATSVYSIDRVVQSNK